VVTQKKNFAKSKTIRKEFAGSGWRLPFPNPRFFAQTAFFLLTHIQFFHSMFPQIETVKKRRVPRRTPPHLDNFWHSSNYPILRFVS
jgi:hypothetical protein